MFRRWRNADLGGNGGGGGEPKTYTQEEVDAMVAARNAALERKANELLGEAKKAKDLLKNYEGFDPAEFKRLQDAAQEAERARATAAGDFKALEQQLVTKYETSLKSVEQEKSEMQRAMEAHLIDAAAANELARHSDTPRLLMPHVRAMMKVVKEDGQFAARIVDQNGNVRIGKGAGTTPMTLSELVDEMRSNPEFAPAFRGTGSSGGGAPSRSTASGGSGVKHIPAGDNAAFLANLKGIATSQVTVGDT